MEYNGTGITVDTTGGLPYTGSELVGTLLLLGVLAIIVGAVIALRVRERNAS